MPIECKILVIDDEPNLRNTLFQIFRRAGHSVTVAASCTEARECLRAGTFHLVFIDLKNTERECQKLISEIRHSHPDLPILML